MSLQKTTKELQRDFLDLQKYPVYETLPAYFEVEYPKFTSFLEKYYLHFHENTAGQYLEDLQYKRDFVKAAPDLLRFLGKELLLGRDYFDKFIDKQNAIQISNYLYRSKGTQFSIQMFFRVFFGYDVDVRYGRDELFLVGDPKTETLVYEAKKIGDIVFPGKTIRFNFDDGDTQVWAAAKKPRETIVDSPYMNLYADPDDQYIENPNDGSEAYVEEFARLYEYNIYYQLRQDIDYTIHYSDKSIEFLINQVPVHDDPWINYLAKNARMQEGSKVKVVTKRYSPAGTAIGNEVTDKRITNNGFWQMFALAIRGPQSVKRWREAYKDFVHPAGMYLEADVLLEPYVKVFGKQPDASQEQYRKLVTETSALLAFVDNQMSELNIHIHKPSLQRFAEPGWAQTNARSVSYYSEEQLDSDRPDRVYRSRINDLKNEEFTLEEWDTQYQYIKRIDEIEARTFDEVFADMSSTINTLDENKWLGKTGDIFCLDSDKQTQGILGNQLDFAPEYPGCPGFIIAIPRFSHLYAQYSTPKSMVNIPTYLAGDSDGFGNAMYPWDSDQITGGAPQKTPLPQIKIDEGAVSGLAYAKITARRNYDPVTYSYDYTVDSPEGSGAWQGDYDTPFFPEGQNDWNYANEFSRAQIQASVKLYHNYFIGRYKDRYYYREVEDSDGYNGFG